MPIANSSEGIFFSYGRLLRGRLFYWVQLEPVVSDVGDDAEREEANPKNDRDNFALEIDHCFCSAILI